MATSQQEFVYRRIELYKSDTLGSGAYGGVCRAKCDGVLCAAKIMHPTLFDLRDPGVDNYLSKFEAECRLLSLARHPNIVQYLTTCQDPDTRLPVLLMELCKESLCTFLERSPGPLAYHTALDISHDIALALVYLHCNGLIHRDLTANNVLLNAGGRAKVTDFGMSKLLSINPRVTPLTLCPGNLQYMSPEALEEPPAYTEKLDIFSLGVLLVQTLTRKFPNPGARFQIITDSRFPDESIRRLVPERERRREHLQLIIDSHPLKRLVLNCLKDKEEERPSANQLSQSLFELKAAPRYSESVEQSQTGEDREQETASLERQVQEMQQRGQQQQQRIEDQQREIDHQRQENNALRHDIDRQRQETERARAQSHQYERELQEQRALMESNTRENHQLQVTIEENGRSLSEKNRTIQTKGRELRVSEELVKEFQQSLVQKDRAISELQQTIAALEKRIEQLQLATAAEEKSVLVSQQTIPSQRQRREEQTMDRHVPSDLVQQPQATSAVSPVDLSKLKWVEGKEAPEGMERGAAIAHGNTVYINPYGSNKVYSFTVTSEDQKWSTLPNSHYRNFSLAVISGQVTSIGGSREGEFTNSLLSLKGEGSNMTWSEVFPPMPTARSLSVSVSTDQVLVVAGGCASCRYFNNVEVLDILTKHWSKCSRLPHPFTYASGVVYGDQLYLAGGYRGFSDPTTSVLTCSLTDLLPSSDGATSRLHTSSTHKSTIWQLAKGLPFKLSTLTTLGGHLIAIGGKDGSYYSNKVYHYIQNTNSWCVVTNMKTQRSLPLVATLHTNQLIVIGGHSKWSFLKTVEIGSLK